VLPVTEQQGTTYQGKDTLARWGPKEFLSSLPLNLKLCSTAIQ
jgi:hypothetical protein